MDVMKAKSFLVFDHFDARAPRILDESHFEETRHVARLRHDFDARCLKRAHLRRQIGERESDVIDA